MEICKYNPHPQKKGPKHTVSNYRPISLTSILCKVMEKNTN